MKVKTCCNDLPYKVKQYGMDTLICAHCGRIMRSRSQKRLVSEWNNMIDRLNKAKYIQNASLSDKLLYFVSAKYDSFVGMLPAWVFQPKLFWIPIVVLMAGSIVYWFYN